MARKKIIWSGVLKPCPCGSNRLGEDVHDARGLFVARVCTICRQEKLKGYRQEIFTDSRYQHDEPLEEEG